MSSYTTNLNLKKPAGEEDVSVLDMNSNYDILDAAVGNSCIYITISSLSALPHTVANSKITANHVVSNIVLSNTAAQPSDWAYTTASGTLTITGTISATTDAYIQLSKAY